ncbi:MAG: hypothetical protein LCH39_11635 [Proteobacteria bacterium]|nr:hypothetical protein [Pseudomonadota bacterium]
MPFEMTSSGKPSPKPMIELVKFDGKLEDRLFQARQEDFSRRHPEGARCSGDPFSQITGFPVDPAQVMSTFRLKKVPAKPLLAMGDIGPYPMISDGLYRVLSSFSNVNMQFFPANLVHDEFELKYWIYRFINSTNCVDRERSGYILTTYMDGKSAWVRPREKPTLYIRRTCVGDCHFWIDVSVQGLLVSDELGAVLAPFLPKNLMLQRAEWA